MDFRSVIFDFRFARARSALARESWPCLIDTNTGELPVPRNCCVNTAQIENQKSKIKNKHHRGVGLVELLITLAITSALLTATAFAMNSALQAYSINQVQSDTMHRTRIAMHRLSTYIRTSTEHSPMTAARATSFANGDTVIDSGIQLFDENNTELAFAYNALTQQLIVTENGNDHVLLRGVTTFRVVMQPMRSSTSIKTGGGFDLLRQATITLTVRFSNDAADTRADDADQTVTLSTSVMPRRNAM